LPLVRTAAEAGMACYAGPRDPREKHAGLCNKTTKLDKRYNRKRYDLAWRGGAQSVFGEENFIVNQKNQRKSSDFLFEKQCVRNVS